MSQPKKKVKKVVTSKKAGKSGSTVKTVSTKSKKIKPTTSRKTKVQRSEPVAMLYKRENFLWMGAGAALVVLGMLLMLGGAMPSPDVWDDSVIYSFRRTVLAPFVIVLGLGVEIYAIFKKA